MFTIITILKIFQFLYGRNHFNLLRYYQATIGVRIIMHVAVLGSGLMGRAIAFDLQQKTSFKKITIIDNDEACLMEAKSFFNDKTKLTFHQSDVKDISKIEPIFTDADVIVSAVPYLFNEQLTDLAIRCNSHFIDLGGNNTVVEHQKKMFEQAEKANVTIIPDSGLAPGLVSILTKDLVDEYGHLDAVKIRVGGLPQKPKEPFNYQLVFSPNGLINEYVEDAIILDYGKIRSIPSLTDREEIMFPEPFGVLEAFTTSGGCSTLPYTYKKNIDYLDYKTIRYKGHLSRIKPILDIGMGGTQPIKINDTQIVPRDLLIKLLNDTIPNDGEDVVLLKVIGELTEKGKKIRVTFEMIDYFDTTTNLSAMMRTTGIPVSVTADLIAKGLITSRGVFTPEEIIPTQSFLEELSKRNIIIKKQVSNR
jgi:lysine 6-dehydrogenase